MPTEKTVFKFSIASGVSAKQKMQKDQGKSYYAEATTKWEQKLK